jgi:cytochrome oxidase Cu insertion factor (SCO1/SenC/PrrC family)
VLVDRRGRLRAYFDGDGTGPRAKIIAAVQNLLEEK